MKVLANKVSSNPCWFESSGLSLSLSLFRRIESWALEVDLHGTVGCCDNSISLDRSSSETSRSMVLFQTLARTFRCEYKSHTPRNVFWRKCFDEECFHWSLGESRVVFLWYWTQKPVQSFSYKSEGSEIQTPQCRDSGCKREIEILDWPGIWFLVNPDSTHSITNDIYEASQRSFSTVIHATWPGRMWNELKSGLEVLAIELWLHLNCFVIIRDNVLINILERFRNTQIEFRFTVAIRIATRRNNGNCLKARESGLTSWLDLFQGDKCSPVQAFAPRLSKISIWSDNTFRHISQIGEVSFVAHLGRSKSQGRSNMIGTWSVCNGNTIE